MTPERFLAVEELYHAVFEATDEERLVLLAGTDPELRREVESLLSQHTTGEFLNRAAMENAPELLRELDVSCLEVGTRLGPYRIENKIGEGGMGEVFRATDTRLGRSVAIKIMPERFSAHFEREARAISSLNHPNICTLYDVGANFLVMELVEGETLAARLQRGPLPIETVRQYGGQTLAALAEAHSKGIVHRDLKPGNIMIGKSGVKVLDFGIAKSAADQTLTDSARVMGTPAYMAPEQRKGKPADARSDIYSFGCLLYEMLTGGRIGTQQGRIRSPRLTKLVNRCLEQNPDRRWQSVAELEHALERADVARGRTKRIVVGAGVLLSLSAGAYFYFHRAPTLTAKDTIVLADFDNKTGDPVFDDTLRQGLSVELQQSPFLSLVSDRQVHQTLALMGRPKDTRLTAEAAEQMCERTASTVVLEGSIASVGSQYVLALRAKNCDTGNVLDQEQATAARREDVLNSLSQIAHKLRTRLGESQAAVEKHSTPLAEATTPSLEALKAYSTANMVNLASGTAAAIPFFRRAIEIDPKFAMAYAYLGLSYSTIGESALSAEITKKAWELRDRASDRERFFIDFAYDRQATGNLERAYQTLESWLKTYPGGEQPRPQGLLGGLATHGTGRYERAIQASKNEIAADPGSVYGYSSLAESYFFLGRFEECESTLRRASDLKMDFPDFPLLRYNIASLKGDRQAMDKAIVLARGKRRVEPWLAHAEALGLARSGHLEAARRSSNRAVDLAVQEGDREAAASYRAARAVWEGLLGNAAEARKNATAALAVSQGRDLEYAAGLALTLAGNAPRSPQIADDLERRFPEDTFAKFTYVPVLRALSALERHKPSEAIEQLQTALRYENAINGLNFNHFYLGGLHSAYLRGEAYLDLHRYADATAEFQKIVDHRGLVGLDPIGALAHWQLGRAYSLSGDTAKAKSAYEDFLAIWKDADRDIPILKQAKAEYARLR